MFRPQQTPSVASFLGKAGRHMCPSLSDRVTALVAVVSLVFLFRVLLVFA